MKILHIRRMRGPNFWSVKQHNLIVMLLDLEEMEARPTNTIPGFLERLKNLIPTLYDHRCSEDRPGGFFERVERGTWMGHVIEHIALEIQSLAGMSTGFGRTRSTSQKGVYHVVFSYEQPKAGMYAAKAAVAIAEALINDQPYDLAPDINTLYDLWKSECFGPSTSAIVQEAIKRNIPCFRLNNDSLVQLGYGKNQKRIEATISSTTSQLAVDLAGDKETTKNVLETADIPVPAGGIVTSEHELWELMQSMPFPVVIKPVDGNHGKGATTNIRSWNEAVEALKYAKTFSPKAICEQRIEGKDFRILVINYKFVAAAMRSPASVTGTGEHTIAELIDIVNSDPRRGVCHENVLTRIRIDDITLNILKKNGYTLDSILPPGQELVLKDTANISTGGTATDVTDIVDPQNILLFERIARVIGLDICGIDVIAPGLCHPIKENGGAVIEVNAAPGFRMHLQPSFGPARNVAEPVIDMLFPNGSNGRIPIIAITGTNGKTTTTRLIAHGVSQAAYQVGYTTTDGIYINKELITSGDCTGPDSTEIILKDPLVDYAVLECARGGLLRSGLAFTHCDVAVITNVAEDHLGQHGIDTVEKLAKVKRVLAETVFPEGWAVLNADDDLVYEMREFVNCNVALFSLDENNPRLKEHCMRGGTGMVYENGYLTVMEKERKLRIENIHNIPITFGGTAEFNIANALAAALALYVQQFSVGMIRQTLRSFVASAETTPGRMNIFNFSDFRFMIDYAHNPHGLKALGKFVKATDASVKIGIIAGVGDRRDQDIIAIGEESAKIFDEIIIRQDRDSRGRTEEEIKELLVKGIRQVDQDKKITFCSRETESIDRAIEHAVPGCFIVLFSDDVKGSLKVMKEYMQKKQPVRRLQVNRA